MPKKKKQDKDKQAKQNKEEKQDLGAIRTFAKYGVILLTIFALVALFIIFPMEKEAELDRNGSPPVLIILECGNDYCEPGEQELCPADCGGVGGITRKDCDEAGGSWTACGSPCAGTDEEHCIQICSPQCQCNGPDGDWTCPEDSFCRTTGEPGDIGICV